MDQCKFYILFQNTVGQFVIVQIPFPSSILIICEVEVYGMPIFSKISVLYPLLNPLKNFTAAVDLDNSTCAMLNMSDPPRDITLKIDTHGPFNHLTAKALLTGISFEWNRYVILS